MLDSANLGVHEGEYLLFGWFAPTLGLGGGMLLQWLAPLLLRRVSRERQVAGFAFSLFFFDNWLYTATCPADARATALALVPAGDSDSVGA